MKEIEFNYHAYDEDFTIVLRKGRYQYGSSLAIVMYAKNEEGMFEDFGTITTNLCSRLQDDEHAFVDTNNYGSGIIDFLKSNNIAVETGFVQQSGFCTYPLLRFSKDMLKKFVRL